MTKKVSLFSKYDSLNELGEFGLIERIAELFGDDSKSHITGIGDDCTVIPWDDRRSLLITTDMLIEDQHFRLDWISANDLGYKSLAVNLSDISAMGGKPESAFLSIGIPANTTPMWLEDFFYGIHELCNKHGVRLLGGDTTRSPGPMVINFAIMGSAATGQILWRSSAKHGDQIAVLGNVGESGAGLKLLMENLASDGGQYNQMIDAHNRPPLFIDEAQFLAKSPAVHAMIDLSDGIQSDAKHIARRSGVRLEIDIGRLPLSSGLREICDRFSWSTEELALTAGEDYGLLFTIGKSETENVQAAFEKKFGYSFTTIGCVKEGSPELWIMSDGEKIDPGKTGFDHFSE